MWFLYLSLKRKSVQFGQVVCPRHVAVIMDGNRRFARRDNVAATVGHRKGFDKLLDMVKWSTFLGIRELKVYAFSIENFKRSEEEVAALLGLASEKFQDILENTFVLVGSERAGGGSPLPRLLPAALEILAAKVASATKHHPRLSLKIAFPYTGRDEISRAAFHLVDGIFNEELLPEDIDEELVTRTLDLGTPGLMNRTSGELVRLSDFMLWQVSNTVLYFTEVLWPDFKIWHFLTACTHYRRYAPVVPQKLQSHNKRKEHFFENMEQLRRREIDRLAAC